MQEKEQERGIGEGRENGKKEGRDKIKNKMSNLVLNSSYYYYFESNFSIISASGMSFYSDLAF